MIRLNREVEFQKIILNRPDRIYFDLKKTRPSQRVKNRTYQVNDLFIKGIRVAQNSPQVTRVVLDFEKIHKHTVFALYAPFRIVIDTQGDKQTVRSPGKFNSKKLKSINSQRKTGSNQVIEQTIPVIPVPNSRGDRTLTRVLGLKVGRVVIDPGHGGKDTGTIGRGGLKEKNLVLEVSLYLKKLLEKRLNLEVVLTRESDKFIPLEERTAVANHLEADLFLSIHANSSKSQQTSGVETFFQGFTNQTEERDVAARENASSQKNVRELENILERSVVLAPQEGQITEDLLPPELIESYSDNQGKFTLLENGASLKDLVSEYEKGLIRTALEKTDWNQKKAAHLLSVNATTLNEKMKRLKIKISSV